MADARVKEAARRREQPPLWHYRYLPPERRRDEIERNHLRIEANIAMDKWSPNFHKHRRAPASFKQKIITVLCLANGTIHDGRRSLLTVLPFELICEILTMDSPECISPTKVNFLLSQEYANLAQIIVDDRTDRICEVLACISERGEDILSTCLRTEYLIMGHSGAVQQGTPAELALQTGDGWSFRRLAQLDKGDYAHTLENKTLLAQQFMKMFPRRVEDMLALPDEMTQVIDHVFDAVAVADSLSAPNDGKVKEAIAGVRAMLNPLGGITVGRNFTFEPQAVAYVWDKLILEANIPGRFSEEQLNTLWCFAGYMQRVYSPEWMVDRMLWAQVEFSRIDETKKMISEAVGLFRPEDILTARREGGGVDGGIQRFSSEAENSLKFTPVADGITRVGLFGCNSVWKESVTHLKALRKEMHAHLRKVKDPMCMKFVPETETEAVAVAEKRSCSLQ